MSLANADLKRLLWPYRVLVTSLLFLCVVVTSFPLFWFGAWLGNRLGIAIHAPIRDQPHGLIWLVMILLAFIALLSVCYFLIFGLLAAVLRWRAGWSSTQAYRLVFYSEVPPSWLKPTPNA
jgi:hypothetical protein